MSDNLIKLRSQDNQEFTANREILLQSETLKNILEDADEIDEIPLPTVSGPILALVLKYCEQYDKFSKNSEIKEEEINNWNKDYVNMEQEKLFSLILAANYLNIRPLLDLTCKTVADMIKHKSPQEIRDIFNIENDFTPEEEEEIQRENKWAFD